MAIMRWLLLLAVCVGTGCRAQPTVQHDETVKSESSAVLPLTEFGAVGDGAADDTAALRRALMNSEGSCLDGGGRVYRVNGTLRAAHNLCLRNVTLLQTAKPVDTTPFLRSRCPQLTDPGAVIDCGNPAVPQDRFEQLWESLSLRTLLIRPGGSEPIEVTLDRVKIDRGRYPEAGSRSDAAGIWLDGAARADLRNVEITGDGKGYGLFITNSSNVTINGLWIHDLTWAPYRGDVPLSESRMKSAGWNAGTIQEFREAGRDGATDPKFYGVRIQEQLTCANLANVSHVRMMNIRIERCLAKFESGTLPWQADGLDLGRSSSDIAIDGATIDSTWEGMDVAAGGTGIDGLSIDNLKISNAFSFGLKLGYELRNARVSNAVIDGAGLSGVVAYGPVRNLRVSGVTVTAVGSIKRGSGRFQPWPAGNRAGLRIDGTPSSAPADVLLEDVKVSGDPGNFEFGILNTGGQRVRAPRLSVKGAAIQVAQGVDP